MSDIDGKKALRIALSVIIALCVWLYIEYTDPIDVKVRAKGVPVIFLGEDTALADKGLVVVDCSARSIDLTLRAPRKYFLNLNTDDIRVLVDLRDIEEVGTHTLSYTVDYPGTVQKSRISVESASVYTLDVKVGELYKKTVEVQYELIGEVADGYISYPAKTEAETLAIHGQQADVMRVSYAKVTCDLTGRTSSVNEMIEPEYYDSGNKRIEDAMIYASRKTLPITVPVYQKKPIALTLDITESAAVGESDVTVKIKPEKLLLAGEYYLMNPLKELSLGTLELGKISDGETLHFPIELPKGIVSLEETEEAEVTVTLKNVGTKEFAVTDFKTEHTEAGFKAEVKTETLTVTLRGRTEELPETLSGKLVATADLSGLTEAGEYTVPASVSYSGKEKLDVVGTYMLTVSLTVESDPAAE